MAEDIRTTCPYCGTGCGVMVSEGRDGAVIGGDPAHPANKGRLCSKGAALGETLSDAPRLLHPEVQGRRVSWDEAINETAARLRRTIDAYGPESVAFYVSGQLLTEDYYVANKLLKGFIGSPHIDTNSRLCMASAVAGHKRAFGEDIVPGCYEDLDLADLVVLVGSNLAWCHPVLYQQLKAARRDRGTRVVVIDPRRTATCEIADLHLALTPGSDVKLFNGLLAHLDARGALNASYYRDHVEGLDEALEAAQEDAPSVERTAADCGLAVRDVGLFYDWFARTERTVTLFSQGVNQSSQGTDKVNAILNVHLATGRIGKPGAAPFSVTGQPNAMGGREVGGLANQLAAHMSPDDPEAVDRVRRFWKAPALKQGEGLKAVDMFRAVRDGRIKAIWIMATNPAVSLPEAVTVREALSICPLVIVSDVCRETDTAAFAHIRLPAAAWGEKDGTVTNSERMISRQRPFRAPPGEAKPDWWIIGRIARALGHGKAFAYTRPAAIFREHAALSAFENGGGRLFDIGALAHVGDGAYEAMEPVRWPLPKGATQGPLRLFADGRFPTPSGRARMIPVRHLPPRSAASERFPLIALTGRYRDQWHTMTRTGLSPRLSANRPEPLIEISPADAAASGVRHGGLARVIGRHGEIVGRVSVTPTQPTGRVFLPIHWTDSMASAAVVCALVPGECDPVSGQPEAKHAPVRVEPFATAWSGIWLCKDDGGREAAPDLDGIDYWCRSRAAGCAVAELAGAALPDAEALARRLGPDEACERLEYHDQGRGVHRFAWMRGGRLTACLFLGRDRPEVARAWIASLMATGQDMSPAERALLLAGRAPGEAPGDPGRVICACFSVGLGQIAAAVRDGKAATAEQVGTLLAAGTGCGSCLPDIEEILRHVKQSAAA